METKFTPWRMDYIKSSTAPPVTGCVFCRMVEAPPDHDRENLVLQRGEHCFVVLNLYPYNPAHLMVIPYLHSGDLTMLEPEAANELFALTRQAVSIISAEYNPQGFNLGMNLGRSAGAGIADHLHMHIVPRWSGDNNFMPIIGQTRIIPEDLDTTYGRLRARFSKR
ncbi:HIT family protein [Candidatus Viridilinea mediisalina]|uniref:HIT family hydrolase n=1 Tax=Candidatus Viridilinea mediisalina TaxID=2024553 RepID=A0A2A6RGQ6_9CHLR|nr:HIT domain-containing protein [Candidatus Viridilinea mediisalina]PDW02040.1 HIT family hydrolase [Candidatus Viridilinea mediisalina]